VVQNTLEGRADYFDVRITDVTNTHLELKKNEVTKALAGKETGACVRVLFRGAWGFASTPEVNEASLKEAADKAAKMARGISESVKEKITLAPVSTYNDEITITMRKSFLEASIEKKLEYLKESYDTVKDYDFILNSTATYKDSYEVEEFYSSEGASIITRTPKIFWIMELVGTHDGNMQSVRKRLGKTTGLEAFDRGQHIEYSREAVSSLISLLNGKAAPAGKMPVIADPSLTGVFAHEAVGHASEGDLITSGNSCFEGRLGQKIASPIVTIVDDSTIPTLFGSYLYDNEGVRAKPKNLIVNGELKDFILNRETAARLGMEPNGGARAESYHGRPLVRMSNTFIERGDSSFKEMLEETKKGVYLKGSRGGQVNTSQGFFQFNAQEAYLIENGEIKKPLRDVSLSGHTLEILSLIDLVGSDLDVGHSGLCGKGQTATVSDGGPHIHISECVVGGR
jgi:TldD protein